MIDYQFHTTVITSYRNKQDETLTVTISLTMEDITIQSQMAVTTKARLRETVQSLQENLKSIYHAS